MAGRPLRNRGKGSLWYKKCLGAGFRCGICHRVFAFEELTRDHIIPKSIGGSNRPSNIRPLCAPCNGRRGAPNAMRTESPPKRREFLPWWET